MHVLVFDVGVSTIAATVLDVATATPVGASVRVPLELDRPSTEAAEVPAERLWSALTAASRQAMRGCDSIAAIGLVCFTPGLVLLDARDKPLAPIWTPLDRRARAAARQVWAGVGAQLLAATGNRPLPGFVSAVQYRQILHETPYLIRDVKRYLHLHSWLGLRLTGVRATDPVNAAYSGLCNTLTDGQWSSQWCDYFNVDPAWLPPIVPAGTTLGNLLPIVAVELGVPPGVPVKLGIDPLSNVVRAAALKPGEVLHQLGATDLLATVVSTASPDPRRLTQPNELGGLHLTYNPLGVNALDWLHQLCYRDLSREQFLGAELDEALRRQTRVGLEPPHLGGDELEIEAHRASFRDLTQSTERRDLFAALLRELRRQHQRAQTALGLTSPPQRVVLVGGTADLIRRLIPEYESIPIDVISDGSWRGVAALFSS